MRDPLDEIPWSSLEHAYGSAEDIPELLRALASDDVRARRDALDQLQMAICHQGTRYTATTAAIRPLLEIAAAAPPNQRAPILRLVTECLSGWLSITAGPYNGDGPPWGEEAPAGLDLDGLEEEDEEDEEDREGAEDDDEERAIAVECGAAAASAIPTVIGWLDAASPVLRAEAAMFLACFRGRAAEAGILAALGQRLAVERAPDVRATLLFALGHTLPLGDDEALEGALTEDEGPLARAVAALLLVRRRRDAAPPAAIERVAALISIDDDHPLEAAYRALPWENEGIASDAAEVLQAVGRRALEGVLPVLVDRLAEVGDFAAVGLLRGALDAAFGDAEAPTSADDLSDVQRRLVTCLVANDEGFWSVGNAMGVLTERGLPSTREAMGAWLGVTYHEDPSRAALRLGLTMRESFGDNARALEEVQRALELNPESAAAWEALGAILHEEGDDEEAREAIERALELDPSRGVALFHRGLFTLDQGDGDGALADFLAAAERLRGPSQRVARGNACTVLAGLGRRDEAIVLHHQNCREHPHDAEAWYGLGLSLVKQGEYDGCVAAIERSFELDPDFANAHYAIACAYALRGGDGDDARALEHIAVAIALEPELREDIAEDEDFEGLQGDPRFRRLVDEPS
ncbi:MAG: tetratricopeptide repeat protein [Nannocystaceae bacterium]